MTRPLATLLLLVAAAAAGCSSDDRLVVTDAYGYAPVTSRGSAVVYLRLHNNTPTEITIKGFRSSDFALVTLHETIERSGRMFMQPIRQLVLPPGMTVELKPGGKHLMLMSPRHDILPGTRGKLRIEFDDNRVVPVEIEFHDRSAPPVDAPQ